MGAPQTCRRYRSVSWRSLMRKTLSLAAALIAALAIAATVGAITNGAPDGGEHPYVGELLFYVPDAPSSRFDDPGSWFTCSGTLLSPTVMVTAGHCTFGVGKDSVSTTHDGADTDAAHGGVGGNDVWVSFAEVPNFDILPASSTFTSQAAPYGGWSGALNSTRVVQRGAGCAAAATPRSEWARGTPPPHPQYDDIAFFTHDAGVLPFSTPVTMPKY